MALPNKLKGKIMKKFTLAVCAILFIAGCANNSPKIETNKNEKQTMQQNMNKASSCGCSDMMPKNPMHKDMKADIKMPCDSNHMGMGTCQVK